MDDRNNILLRYITESNPFCCFRFNGTRPKVEQSRKRTGPSLVSSGRCTFSTCPVQFNVKIEPKAPSQFILTITFLGGNVKHCKEERKSRRIHGANRQKLRESLSHESPSTLHNKLYTLLTDEELLSGKRDTTGSSITVIQKISSEGNLKKQNHPDLLQSLLKLSKHMKESCPGKIPGYIQRIIAEPFGVICFSEDSVRLYHLAKTQSLFFDATGTVVSMKKTNYEGQTVLYYSLVMQHPVRANNPPVAVAEYLTADQSSLSIGHFLECFLKAEEKLYGMPVQPIKIVIDRSPTLLKSCTKVFFNETVSAYLHRCFRIVIGCPDASDFDKGFIFACIAHVMKSIKHDLKAQT